jgi:hypothetical protein
MDVEGIDPGAVYAALMSTLVRTVFAQPDAALAWAQHALLSTSGRFGAAQPVGVGDLDLSSRGWKPQDAHLGASQRVCAGVLMRLWCRCFGPGRSLGLVLGGG